MRITPENIPVVVIDDRRQRPVLAGLTARQAAGCRYARF
jgi:hypothetical protein